MRVYLNGKILPERRAAISIHDHGFLYGDGVYETLRVYDGDIFMLAEHLDRLREALARIGLKAPLSLPKIGEVARKVVLANRHREAAVRVTVTRGPGPHGLSPALCRAPTLLITSRPFQGYPPKFFERGMTVAISSVLRTNPLALPPSIKSISCLNGVLAKLEADRRGADEALLLAEDGSVAEGSVSNIFLVKAGRVFTPALDGRQLPGVARARVCRLVREGGLRVIETKVTVPDLLAADEVFLTNTLMEVMPVGKVIPCGETARVRLKTPGPITRRMMICYTPPRRKSNRVRGII